MLLASGYIAGGAIAGILIAFMAGVMADFTGPHHARGRRRTIRSSRDAHADLLSMMPFAVLMLLLCLVAHERAGHSNANR